MKGDRIFNDSITNIEAVSDTEKAGKVKSIGRNPELIAKRNETMIYRYYYYTAFSDKRWDAILKILADEFFLSEITVSEIVTDNAAKRREIEKQKPSLNMLKRKYPSIKW